MAMPEAAIHEDGGLRSDERHVWSARQLPVVQPISQTSRMQRLAHQQFDLGVATTDAGHHPATCSPVNCVHVRPA